ncbi:tyrosine-type recombinase/integrase [Streptomyces mirabilis]|uniref:tyrosine-type recombinase/integrase n=1 Tax=Streptomyces mirabilis TaxID=68239 RepID=UPI003688EB13
MRCHRDRATLATYISSGVRASELLGMACGDVDFGRATITVVGKGSRERQVVPISPDAVVWIRLSRSSRVTGRAGRNRVLSATARKGRPSRSQTRQRRSTPKAADQALRAAEWMHHSTIYAGRRYI